MTDLLKHNILNEMSSAFNNQSLPPNETLPSVSEDTTLKWRGLLNNTYAAKEKQENMANTAASGREVRKRSASFKEKSSSLSSLMETADIEVKEQAPDEVEEIPEASPKIESSMVTATTTTADNVTDKPSGDKRTTKVRSKPPLDKSDRSLRSNRSAVESPVAPPVSPKMVRRGRRRKDEPDVQVKVEAPPTEAESEKPRLILTIRPKGATVVSCLPTEPPASSPKKRGRKPKGDRAKRSDDSKVLNQRPLRRIKPTQKILDSEELREKFVQENCNRLNITNEEIKSLEESNNEKKQEEDRRLTRRVKRETPKSESSNDKTEKTPPESKTSAENSELKKALDARNASLEGRSIKRSLVFPADPVKSAPSKPCPDPEEFLREIKSSKLGISKSPEENKKLNKKQLKRLQRNKEKHFQLLGLQRIRRLGSETENSDEEIEEFIPKQKLNNVGRPGVTLRLRNFRKEAQDKEAVRNGGKKRKREPSPSQQKDAEEPPGDEVALQVVPANPVSTTPEDSSLICFCAQASKYFLQRTAAISHCCAIDEVEGQKIGCTNEVHGDLLQLLRPSARTSYMVLCESHKKRIVSHNCCAGCGIFLTQGIFSLCPNRHFFHRDCTMKYILNAPYDPASTDFTGPTLAFKCPHCGLDVPDSSFRVTMKSENVPVFFTNQKLQTQQRAKMSVGSGCKPPISTNSFLLNVERLIPDEVMESLQRAGERLKSQPPRTFTAKDLFYAIYHNSAAEKIAEIVASGFDLTKPFKEFNNGTCLHLVASLGNIATLFLILSRVSSRKFINLMDRDRRTAVMCAVVGRKNDIVKVLVQFGANVTLKGPEGMTALHLAAKIGNFAAAQIILDYFRQSSSVLRTEQFLNKTDNGHWTALVWAAEIGHADIVSYLISLGADVNVCDLHNNTVLHWAALSGKVDTIYPLMLPNTHYNRQNINGDTALHIACRQGNTRICLALVANGANLYVKNETGKLPIDCVPEDKAQCARVLQFNMEMRSLGNYKERKVLCHDISNGREYYPIQILQRLGNDESMTTPEFKYVTRCVIMQETVQVDYRVSQMRVCSCSDACTSDKCQCGQISIQNWYNADGRLINDFNYDDPAMIFECSDVCGCNIKVCKNRVVQRGTKLPFQVFECDEGVKGLGVRCMAKIPKGTFVAEYLGEILTEADADKRSDDSFFFELGASEHCIDAKFYGNITRFFNHSCDANLVPIRVYYHHQDIRFPKIAFFANRDIDTDEELTFDYGAKFWMVKYKQFTCHCGSKKCRYSATSILKTLEEFNQRNSCNN